MMARGSSHIRYFKRFAQFTFLNVQVVNVNRARLKFSYLKHWSITKDIDINALLKPHLIKKQRKFPILSRTPFWAIYNFLMPTYIKCDIVKYIGLITENNIDVVGTWNGQKLPSSAITEAAKYLKKDIVFFENGLLPNTATCDWEGVNCHNSLPRDVNFYQGFNAGKVLPTHLIPRAPSGKKAKGIDTGSLPNRFIFVPFQMETDSQIVTNSPWIRTMAQLVEILASVIGRVRDPSLQIVIKEHPSEVRRHDHLHGIHPKIHFSNESCTQELIEKSEAVITINSTVGIESLLLGKSVIVLGKACYDVDNVCKRVSSEDMLLDALNNPAQYASCPEVRKSFLNFINDYYVIPTAWSKADETHFEALTQRLLKEDKFSELIKKRSQKEK